MTERDDGNSHNRSEPLSQDNAPPVELDAASKSLSEAFRISFVVLKIIMIVLLGLFLLSGFETVDSDEQAIVLRFGKIRGTGEGKILKPRAVPYWVFPYPIEEIVKIPVEKVVELNIRSFWYYQSEEDLIAESQGRSRPVRESTLDPMRDGYCLTRSEKQGGALTGADGSDYSIVHSKWQLRYRITDPEQFFRNVFIRDAKPGEIYFNVMTESINPLLKALLEDAVVSAMVNYTIDEAIKSQDRIPGHVRGLVQDKLDSMKEGATQNICGIRVSRVLLTDITWPRQVNDAFQAAHNATQDKQTAISDAETYARNKLNEAAGPVAEKLYAALQDPSVSDEFRETLWAQLAGEAQQRIFDAMAYQAKVVADAKANADYFLSLLPEYRKYPTLAVQSIYRDAVEEVFANVDEKFIVEPTKGEEIMILISRDRNIKPKTGKQDKEQENTTN